MDPLEQLIYAIEQEILVQEIMELAREQVREQVYEELIEEMTDERGRIRVYLTF